MNDLVIIGAGGFGRETAALVEAINTASPAWTLRGFVDDDTALRDGRLLGYPVLGDLDWLVAQSDLHYVIGIGHPATRRAIAHRLEATRLQAATLVHPDVPHHRTNAVGAGSIICRGATFTVDTTVGRHVIVNLHCTVGHDARIGDFSTLHPGVHLSGASRVGPASEMGTGAVLLPEVSVGACAVVGAGAVVTRDLPEACTAVGVPARSIDAS